MKMIITILTMTASFAFADSTVLLQYNKNSGLFGNFQSQIITVDANGPVTLQRTVDGVSTSEVIATFSRASIDRIEATIAAIDDKTPLVDDDKNRPSIQDAGGEFMDISKSGAPMTIYQLSQGHHSYLKDHVGLKLVQILNALDSLAN
jgi:hypothetical protein